MARAAGDNNVRAAGDIKVRAAGDIKVEVRAAGAEITLVCLSEWYPHLHTATGANKTEFTNPHGMTSKVSQSLYHWHCLSVCNCDYTILLCPSR